MPEQYYQAGSIMAEKDILRIALTILLLGFSLPGIFKRKSWDMAMEKHGLIEEEQPADEEHPVAVPVDHMI